MELNGSCNIAASRETVWEALRDPALLRRCIPGCESLERLSDTEYEGVVAAKIGPVRTRFAGRLTVGELSPPESCSLAAEAADPAAGGVKGDADLALSEDDGVTTFAYAARFEASGKIAQLGSRLVSGVARQTAESFLDNLSREINERAAAGEAPPLADAPPMIHEEPAEQPTPVLEAPPLAAGAMAAPAAVSPPPPAIPETPPAPSSPVANDALAPAPAGRSAVTRIMLVAAVVVVVGVALYYLTWPAPV
jgi:carbon monoxide dehydrogenase subunit G